MTHQYNPKDFGKVFHAEDTKSAEVVPVTRADETSTKWASAFNYRVRCEMDLAEAMDRHQKSVAEEAEAWNNLEVASGRVPEAGQGVQIGSPFRGPIDPRIR